MNVNELIQKYNLTILEQNGKRGVRADRNPSSSDKKEIISNMADIISELDRRDLEKKKAYEEHQKKIDAIEGLREIEDAIEAINQRRNSFVRAWESGESAYQSMPNIDVGALKAKYPRAAAYLEAEDYSMSSYYVKAAAGHRAVERILNGEDYETVLKDMEAEARS